MMKGCIPEYADIPLEDIPSYIEMSSINTADYEYIDDHQVEVTDEAILGAQIKYDIQFEATIPMKQKEAGKSTPADKKVRDHPIWKARQKDDPGYPLIKRALVLLAKIDVKTEASKGWISAFGLWQDLKGLFLSGSVSDITIKRMMSLPPIGYRNM